jgi:cAMP phosphodiesterase
MGNAKVIYTIALEAAANRQRGLPEMKIKVLGASGSEVPGHKCPGFLIDGKILMDAGTVRLSLDIGEENHIRHILLTHAHFDHIKGIPFLLDNIAQGAGKSITILSGKEVLDDLEKNIFNDRIWPDFRRLPSSRRPLLKYRVVPPSRAVSIEDYKVVMEKVDHTVPSFGFIVENGAGKAVVYAGDTGPTFRLWKRMADFDVGCLIVETSFPNRLEKLALTTGHLTPSLLEKEIAKLPELPPRIYVMHLKPQYLPEIEVEIGALKRDNIDFLKEGDVIQV